MFFLGHGSVVLK